MQTDRLQIWTEQGNVTISQLFFHHYKKIGITDSEAMLMMHIIAYSSEGNFFPTPHDLSSRMNLTLDEVSSGLQRMIQKSVLSIVQEIDEKGVLFERFSLMPLWNRLVDLVVEEENRTCTDQKKEEEGEIYRLFEQEFGRLLSPMECETIAMWFDQDGHTAEVIKAALKEGVLAQKLSLRYIDRILFEWKKKNVKTVADAERHARHFRTSTVPPRQERQEERKTVPFYNWLEERE